MARAGWFGMVAFACACGAVVKPAEPDRRLAIHSSGALFDASNGFHFAALPDDTAQVVRLDVRYPVGEIDDPPGKEGLAHLVEHLMFDVMIVRDGKRTSVGAELGRLALSWNAETTKDYTHYETYAKPEAIDALLAIEVDRLAVGCGGLTKEILAREREVVINELRERQGASGAALQRQILDAVYPAGHPYRAVDTIDSMGRIELKDVCDLLGGPYHQGIVDVIASGAISVARLEVAATEHFGTVRPRKPATRAVPQPIEPRPGTQRLRADVDEPTLIVTWPLPDRGSRAARMLQLVWPRIPGRLDGFAIEFKWGHDAHAEILGGTHAPVLAVSVELASLDKVDEAIAAVESSVEFGVRALGSERATPDWQATWQDRAESLLAHWEDLGGRNRIIADLLDAGAARAGIVGLIDELTKAGPDEPRDLGDHWLAMSRSRAIILEPSGSGGAGGLARTYTANGAGHERGTEVDLASADVALPVPRIVGELELEQYQLPDGLDVILWPHGEASLVQGRLVIGSGTALDPVGKEGMAALAGATETFVDNMVFADRQLSTRADELVQRLVAELRKPGYEVSDTQRSFLKSRLQAKRARERSAYARDLLVAVYGPKHPYARLPITESSVDQLQRNAVLDWARENVVPKNATLVISGQFDAALIKQHIAYAIDPVAAGAEAAPVETEPAGHRDWVAGITAKPSPTVELDVRFAAGSGLDRDYPKRLVLAQVLTNQLARLRGDKAVTYGLSASYEPRAAGGLWSIGGDVDASRAAEAAGALVGILAEMRRDPDSYRGAFVLARQKILEGLMSTSASSEAVADRLVLNARFHLPGASMGSIADYVASLTLAGLHQFLVRELSEERQVFGAFGNAAPVRAALTAAGGS